MNRYVFLCRIKWPVMLLVFGVTALLDQWNILSYGQSWPLYLIVYGMLMLAERAAWSQAQQYPDSNTGYPAGYPVPYQGPNQVPYGGQPGSWGGPSGTAPSSSSTALSVTPPDAPRGFEREDEGRK